MCKSVAVLLLIIAFAADAVNKQAGWSIPIGDVDSENVSAEGKMTSTLGDTETQHQQTLNIGDSSSVKKELAGVGPQKEDHAPEDIEEREALKVEINKKTAGEEKQAVQAGSPSSAGESAGVEMSSGGTEAQHHRATNPHESESDKEDKSEVKIHKEEHNIDSSSDETETWEFNDDTGMKGEIWDVSMKCLDCLCYFATDCNMERKCEEFESTDGLGVGFEKGDCGPFHISFPFWADAYNKKMDIGDAKMENEWRKCSLDLMCSTETIQKYFHKYHNDCNGDGKVDCIDYHAIHTLGPFGCMVQKNIEVWNGNWRKDILKCMASSEEGAYAKKMKELNEKMERQDIGARKLAEIEKNKSSNTVEPQKQSVVVTPKGKTVEETEDQDESIQGGIIQL